MALFQGLFFLVLGIGIFLVLYQSLSRGWLPCGPNGFKGRVEFHRDRQPFLFWFMFALYAVAGSALTILALRILAGNTAPLPLQ